MKFKFILCLLILTMILPTQGIDLNYTEYTNSFILSGSLNLINEGTFNLDGILDIRVNTTNDIITYDLDYSTVLPVYQESGNATFREFIDSKILISDNQNSTSISFMWDLFAPSTNSTVFSIFRILPKEIENKATRILNYTTSLGENIEFNAPDLNMQISAYRVIFNAEQELQYTLFYDTRYNVLLGFDIFVGNSILKNNRQINLIGVISKSTLELPNAGENPNILRLYLAGGVIIGLSTILLIAQKFKFGSKKIIQGGID